MQIAIIGDNKHEMSNPVVEGKKISLQSIKLSQISALWIIYNVDTEKPGRVYIGRNVPTTFWLMIAIIIAFRHLYIRKQ